MFKIFAHKLSSNASTVIVFVAAFGYLAYLNSVNPDKAGDQLLPVLGAAGAIARLLYQADETKAKANEAVAVASESKAVSVDNADALATIATKVDDNTLVTDSTHALVNGHAAATAAAAEENARQRVELAEQKAEIAALVELARTTLAELTARDQGIVEGRAQMSEPQP
jgi:autotransporter adhesin